MNANGKALPGHARLSVLTPTDRAAMGLYLGLVFVLSQTLTIAVHECGHALVMLLLGNTVYGIHITPWAGQVLAIVDHEMFVEGVYVNLAGVVATQLLLMINTVLAKRLGKARWLFLDSFIMMLSIACLFDMACFATSGIVGFGDAAVTATSFGCHPIWLALASGGVLFLDLKLVAPAVLRWRREYCPRMSKAQNRQVAIVFFAFWGAYFLWYHLVVLLKLLGRQT
ncbi:MAG: hypothetical protein NTW86_26455 [Candidatus Sumerlaeota bacterium]|nr:hypothetical protein [Candidatus Sumerlaeota bacterium]